MNKKFARACIDETTDSVRIKGSSLYAGDSIKHERFLLSKSPFRLLPRGFLKLANQFILPFSTGSI
jgi:hypothetical protein